MEVDEFQKLLGNYRGHPVSKHPQTLVISEWTQIIASFGEFQANPTGAKNFGYSIIVNGQEWSDVMLDSPNGGTSTPNTVNAKITIGDETGSFKGSIGSIEIFTPGAVAQTSKYHLAICF